MNEITTILARKKKKKRLQCEIGESSINCASGETEKAYKIIKAHFSSPSPAAVVQWLKRRASEHGAVGPIASCYGDFLW